LSSILPISTKRTIKSHFKWTNRTQKRPSHLTMEIQIMAWDRHKYVVELNNRLLACLSYVWYTELL